MSFIENPLEPLALLLEKKSSSDLKRAFGVNWKAKAVKGLIKCLGPLLFLVLLLKVVDPKVALELLKGVRWELCVLSLVFFPWVIGLHAWRWWMIARLVGMRSGFKRLFQVYWVGWFLGFLPPGGLAVIAKIYYLKQDGEPVGRTSVSLGADKLFDLVSTCLFAMYGLLYFQGSLFPGYGMGLGLLGGISLVVFLIFRGKWLWKLLRRASIRYLRKSKAGLKEAFLESDKAAESLWEKMNLGLFLKLTLISMSLELSRATVFFVLARALGLNMSVAFAFGCRALVGLVQAIPITVGGLGTREAVLVLAFPLAGLSLEAAVALGFLSFLWNVAFHLSGVFCWLREPVSYKRRLGVKKDT